MTRNELINAILGIRPNILKKEVLETLNDDELETLYKNNRFYNYYENVIRHQKASVIRYVYGERYSDVYLYSINEEEFEFLYLSAIKMTKEEFDVILNEGLEEFRTRATEEGNEEYLSFSREEQIIASGVIIPADLLTEEEYETKSTLLRIHQIVERIKELKEENDKTEELINGETNYMAVKDFRDEISSNNLIIWKLEAELKSIMAPNSEGVVRKRTDGQPR